MTKDLNELIAWVEGVHTFLGPESDYKKEIIQTLRASQEGSADKVDSDGWVTEISYELSDLMDKAIVVFAIKEAMEQHKNVRVLIQYEDDETEDAPDVEKEMDYAEIINSHRQQRLSSGMVVGSALDEALYQAIRALQQLKPVEEPPKTKPSINWDHVAPEFKWLAVDDDGNGECCLFESKPTPQERYKHWSVGVDGEEYRIATTFASFNRGDCPWDESLTKRPDKE